MKRLNESSLKAGDIVLTTTTAAVSKAIRAATGSDISHAMIYVEDRSVIDATAEGVQARNTQRVIFEDDCAVYALRLQDGLSSNQARDICNFIRERIGTQYSKKEAIKAAVGGARGWSKKQFCSRLVAQSYAAAGINLVRDSNFCSPAAIKDSSVLIEVQNPTVSITPEEAAHWKEHEDTTEMMRAAINAVLGGARAKNKSIQNFNDLDFHLAEHPEDDEYFCDLLITSGCLTVWKIEKEKNPWQYDLDLMTAFPTVSPSIEDYCWSVLSNEEFGSNRYIVNHGGYAQFSKQFGLRYFQMMMELYDVLATLHRRRVEVATKWLGANNLLVTAAEQFLRPHTPEWFAALDVWNPPQAAMTRIVVESAGNLGVCSICGDEPAKDYRLEEECRPAGGVDTLRLCNDCLEIRRNMGEPFVSLPEEQSV
jgi:hypothetical protein